MITNRDGFFPPGISTVLGAPVPTLALAVVDAARDSQPFDEVLFRIVRFHSVLRREAWRRRIGNDRDLTGSRGHGDAVTRHYANKG